MKAVADTLGVARSTSRSGRSEARADGDRHIAKPATPSCWRASGPWSTPGRATATDASPRS